MGRQPSAFAPASVKHRRPKPAQQLTRSLSKSQKDAIGRLRINMGKRRPMRREAQSRTEFKTNLFLAMRTALGVVIASAFVTKASSHDSTGPYPKVWSWLPDWYIFGGINFIAVACVFAAGRNIGATMREMFQQKMGVFMAFAFNAVLFWCFEPRLFRTPAEASRAIADGTLMRITTSFGGTPYYVNNGDFFTVLPFTMLFNALVLALPFEAGTKKFSMVNNLLFALTVVSPNEYNDAAKLKDPNSTLYESANIVNNLFIYMCLGLIGAFLSFIVVWVPCPIFAIRKLQVETASAAETIEALLHLVVDAYCFKKKDVQQMHFLRTKLQRKFDLAAAKKDAMTGYLNDAWWEQCIGLAGVLGFKKTVVKPYIDLYASLLDTVRAMNQALQLERYERLHDSFMRELQQDIAAVQVSAMRLLKEISFEVHQGHTALNLGNVVSLERQVNALLARFQATHTKLYSTMAPTIADVEGNIPLNLFLFALQSLCSTMIEFQAAVDAETHDTPARVHNFLRRSLRTFVDPARYTRAKMQTAFKVWLALLLSCFLSVYVFGYSATTATTIAYVMGNTLGGSFGISWFRAVGVVAGVVIPSIALFFICAYGAGNSTAILIFRDIFLFIWTTASMYVKWKGGLDSYAGLCAAFIAAGILLPDDICPSPASLSSYANVVQMTLGVLLIVGVELTCWPDSPLFLLRTNLQRHLRLCQGAFATLFEQTLRADGVMNAELLAEMRSVVQVKAPALLNEQKLLLREALFEPRLWSPAFSQPKYTALVDCCARLSTNTMILYKLALWYQYKQSVPRFSIEPPLSRSARDSLDETATPREAWAFSTSELGAAIHDTFDTLHDLFGASFRHADADQTALFVQMKEAFRLADTDSSGAIDATEVKELLLRVFEQSGALPVDAVDQYVADFMDIVNQDKSGKVSFSEFMEALENGLLLEVEVLPQTIGRPTSATLLGSVQECSVSIDVSPLLTPSMRGTDGPGFRDGVCRPHDILDVETFSLLEAADTMRCAYAAWLLDGDKFQAMAMEELLLLNSLISGVSGIAKNLASLEETVVQP
ncbi:transmembrane protein [Achlya hypogyna]|uniref:Transmembrane protein n=1 Tax=Achlya hypogyna TaxID=1202772 RepID=A0A1V9YVT5_ACHHY|nr:transmembrane protein [Achlya hypogyna]